MVGSRRSRRLGSRDREALGSDDGAFGEHESNGGIAVREERPVLDRAAGDVAGCAVYGWCYEGGMERKGDGWMDGKGE